MEVLGRHARTCAITRAQFLLQIRPIQVPGRRRKTSRVTFLMCSFSVRGLLSVLTAENSGVWMWLMTTMNSWACEVGGDSRAGAGEEDRSLFAGRPDPSICSRIEFTRPAGLQRLNYA